MKPLTERQRWMLRRAVTRGECEIYGRGGKTVARGIEKRGLGTVERELIEYNNDRARVRASADAGGKGGGGVVAGMTDRQKAILRLLLDHEETENGQMGYGLTPNDIGAAVCPDAKPITAYKGWHGTAVMGPAQRVIGSLNGLSKRGLVACPFRRKDGLSGTAYGLTEAGRAAARYVAGKPKEETMGEGYVMENAEAIDPDEAMFSVGERVMVRPDEEGETEIEFAGEEGEVKGVGRGTGFYQGTIVYDVLIDDTSEPWRFTEDQLEGA